MRLSFRGLMITVFLALGAAALALHSKRLGFAYWLVSIAMALWAVVVARGIKVPRQYSLRSLLIAMTLIAVVLGLVYLVSSP